ncbi:MAG: protoheme IX farnesyltransferase, partial [Vicingaceae bacterium]
MDLTTEQQLSIPTTFANKIADYAAFFKLRLASLVVFSAILGYLIAVESIIWVDLFWLCLGGFLVTGSSNGYNQIIERDLDKLMDRTKVRPLVTGRMTKNEALVVAGVSGGLGVLILWFLLNPLSGVLALISLVLYVAVY